MALPVGRPCHSHEAPPRSRYGCGRAPPRLSRPGGAAGPPGRATAKPSPEQRECRGRDERGQLASALGADLARAARDSTTAPRPQRDQGLGHQLFVDRERRARGHAARTRPAATHGRARRASDSTTTAGALSLAMAPAHHAGRSGQCPKPQASGRASSHKTLMAKKARSRRRGLALDDLAAGRLTAAATSAARPPPASRRPAGLSARLLITPRALSAGAPKARRVQPRHPARGLPSLTDCRPRVGR